MAPLERNSGSSAAGNGRFRILDPSSKPAERLHKNHRRLLRAAAAVPGQSSGHVPSFRTSVGDCCWGAGEYDQQDLHSLALGVL